MYVHEKAELVYLASPRTGSISTAAALMDIGFKQVGTHHSTMIGRGCTTFTTIRNHWDAAVSWVFGVHLGEYKDLVISTETIKFALNNEYISGHEMWGVHPYTEYTLEYALLDEDLNWLLKEFDLPPVCLPASNVSSVRAGRHYREFHTDETRAYIHNRFKEEIERLGYEY